MIIFKAGVKIIRKNALTLIIYISAFLLLTIFINQFSNRSSITEFTEIRPDFTLINRDTESEVISGLQEFLKNRADEIILEDDNQILIDANVYGEPDCIFIIPEGFSESINSAEVLPIEKLSARGSSSAYWMSDLVDQYLHVFMLYRESLPDIKTEEISKIALENLSISAEVDVKNTAGTNRSALLDFFQLMGYTILTLMILIVSTIIIVIQRPELRMRNLSSPVSNKNQNLQIVFCIFFVCLAAWIFLVIIGALLYRDAWTFDLCFVLILLNSFIFLLVSVCIAFFVSSFVKGSSTQNFAANIVALSFSFLGGVFVPLDMLGEQVLQVSRFVPTYWYITVLNKIDSAGGIDFTALFQAENYREIRIGMLIQLGFAAAFLITGLAISRVKAQSGHGFTIVKTQIN